MLIFLGNSNTFELKLKCANNNYWETKKKSILLIRIPTVNN